MKMPLLLLAFLLPIQAQPHERSFDDRVRQAKQLEDTNDGKAYQEALWKKVGTYTAKAMQRCFPRRGRQIQPLSPWWAIWARMPSSTGLRFGQRQRCPAALPYRSRSRRFHRLPMLS